jgi:hypothetical protein
MFKLFSEKPDHPMFDLDETRRLLLDLPNDDFKALEEVTSWLGSVKDAAGFRPELRAAIIMLLDETGQPFQSGLLQRYLSAPHLQDFQGLHLWQGIHGFMQALEEAYAVCMGDYRQTSKRSPELKELMPLICTRLLRALAEQMKLELMRYIEVAPEVWQRLYKSYYFAEYEQFAESMVLAYPRHVIHTNPQRELLRALVLYISSPATMAADHIEVSYRIAGRLVSFFDFKSEPDAACPYCCDLTGSAPPRRIEGGEPVSPAMRFFAAHRALPALEKIIDQNENDPVWQERRFGSEFTPAGKLTVLRHLMTYWAKQPPHRHQERHGISAAIEVTHGFRAISKLVTRIDIGQVTDLSEEDAAALKEREQVSLTSDDDVRYEKEVWQVQDMSGEGLGGVLPRNGAAWVKIGDLCGLKAPNGPLWWVGMIRRLHTDPNSMVHVGVEVLAKKPVSVWLRALGKGAEKASNWETSSGSFAYSYLPVILLPDIYNSYVNATMLMESGSYVSGNIYQVMMGEKSRDIKLTALLAEGEDYEQVSFQWLNPEHA